MAINRKRFLGVFLASNVLLAGVLIGILSADTALAVPYAGLGGFVITFDQLEGEGLQQNPTIASNDDCAAFPAAMTQMDQAEVQNLHLYSDLSVPDMVPGDIDTIRINIMSDSAQYQGLVQEFTHLQGDITFPQGQQIESQASGDVDDQFQITAPEILIEDGVIHAHTQFTNSISLTGSTISLETNPDELHEPHEVECPVPADDTDDHDDYNDADDHDDRNDADDHDEPKD